MPAKEVIIIASLVMAVFAIKSVRDVQNMWEEERAAIAWADAGNRFQLNIERERINRNGDPAEAFARRYAAEQATEEAITLATPDHLSHTRR